MTTNYIVYDYNSPQGREMTSTQLVDYAKQMLRIAKKNGFDKDFKINNIVDSQDAWFYLEERARIKVEKGDLPKNRQWIVVDENLKPITGIAGITKTFAIKVAKEMNDSSKDKKHRMYSITKGHKYTVERFTR